MTDFYWFIAGALVALAGLLVVRRMNDVNYAGTIGVEPTQPWPTESLFERHVNHAIEALERDMSTDAAIEDALGSAEGFIHHARRELATRTEESK